VIYEKKLKQPARGNLGLAHEALPVKKYEQQESRPYLPYKATAKRSESHPCVAPILSAVKIV